MSNVDGSICHFNFPKVMLANILSELGTFWIVLLCAPFRSCLLIYIEIGLHNLTDIGQKYVGTFFFETGCRPTSIVFADVYETSKASHALLQLAKKGLISELRFLNKALERNCLTRINVRARTIFD